MTVSIHASSREDATSSGRFSALMAKFQSTRPRGRTRLNSGKHNIKLLRFNPRVLAGGRDSNGSGSKKIEKVSIHASSREDATSHTDTTPHRTSFNPQPPHPPTDSAADGQGSCGLPLPSGRGYGKGFHRLRRLVNSSFPPERRGLKPQRNF